MKIPSNRTRQDMETAAELRAAGATWETIAAQLHRQRYVVARWVKHYAEEWERLLREAEERTSRHADNESRNVARLLLRDNSPKVRLDAANSLARRRQVEKAVEPPPDPRSDLTALVAQVEQMSDDELQQFLVEFMKANRE